MTLVPLVNQNFQTQGVLSGAGTVTQGNVTGGYVDLTNAQTISGNKVFLGNVTIISGNCIIGNPNTPNLLNEKMLIPNKVVIRQIGNSAVEGIDEVHIYHDGTDARIEPKSGNISTLATRFRFDGSSSPADIFFENSTQRIVLSAKQTITGSKKIIVAGYDGPSDLGFGGQYFIFTNAAGTDRDVLVERISTGNVCISGNFVPGGAGRTLGTSTFKWSDVFSTLINSADYTYENNWRTMELEKFPGYPKGVAVTSSKINPPQSQIKNPMEGIPTFAIADDFIEINGRRITMAMLDKLVDLIK